MIYTRATDKIAVAIASASAAVALLKGESLTQAQRTACISMAESHLSEALAEATEIRKLAERI